MGCGEGAGDEEVDFTFAICWHARGSGETGPDGAGIAGVIFSETDGASDEGPAKSAALGEALTTDGKSACVVESG